MTILCLKLHQLHKWDGLLHLDNLEWLLENSTYKSSLQIVDYNLCINENGGFIPMLPIYEDLRHYLGYLYVKFFKIL